MNDNLSYDITNQDQISLDNMNFTVIHLHPKYSHQHAETVKDAVEVKLFDVFKKYTNRDSGDGIIKA